MNLPNKITITRILMIPLFVLFYYLTQLNHNLLYAAIVFALAAFTDFLDGYIARKYNLVTDLGKFLDPIADKVLVLTAFMLMKHRAVFINIVEARNHRHHRGKDHKSETDEIDNGERVDAVRVRHRIVRKRAPDEQEQNGEILRKRLDFSEFI